MLHNVNKIGILGAGAMGGIILESLVNVFPVNRIMVFDRNQFKLKQIKKKYRGINCLKKFEDLTKTDCLILAIKPQDFFKLPPAKCQNTLVVSIMAGITVKQLKEKFNANQIIRAIPNTPAKLNLGFTVWTATKQTATAGKIFIKKLWNLMGQEMYVKRENLIDKATAITGSGPAYVFNAGQSFVSAAQKIGFSEADSKRMVLAVFDGSLALLKHNQDFDELIKQVASKGGTTQAALKEFKKNQFNQIWLKAVRAALKRSGELRKK